MKFLCSNCKAKYQIPDEKIAGRTLKMDCRRCNTPITIRGDQPPPDDFDAAPLVEPEPQRPRASPAAAASPQASMRARPAASTSRPAGASPGGSSVGAHPAGAGLSPRSSGRSALGADFRRNVGGAGLAASPEAPRVTPLDQWHVAINDVPVGPMKRDEIARKIAAGAVNADSLAWREGFDDWRPIREIPELAALLRRATMESERPAGRPGAAAPRGAAPRAPAPRPGPAPAARAPVGPAPAGRATGRSNVVPIGGRLGASAAPTYDLDDGDEPSTNDGEATTVASAADLGLSDFGKPARDDGAIPAPAAKKKEEEKPAARAAMTGGLKPIPPPAAKPAPAPKAAPAPAPAAKVSTKPAPAPVVVEEDDDAGLPPIEAAVAAPVASSKRASFAPPPAVAEAPAAPVAVAKPSTPPPREERRGGLGVGAMMGIAGAMAAGAVLMYGLVQRFILAPPPPTTTIVATVATVTPSTDTQHEAPVDVTPPPVTDAVVPPTTELAPPPTTGTAAPATTTTGAHRPTGPTPPTTTVRPPTTHAPSGPDPFAQFADDGAGPAPIATTTTAHHDDPATHHSSAELTAEQISAVRRSGQRGLTQCWETALRQAGHVDGDVRYDIDITIGTSGRVTVVHARGPTVGLLQDCLERGVRRWVFPPSSSETQTTFPIVFSAQQ